MGAPGAGSTGPQYQNVRVVCGLCAGHVRVIHQELCSSMCRSCAGNVRVMHQMKLNYIIHLMNDPHMTRTLKNIIHLMNDPHMTRTFT